MDECVRTTKKKKSIFITFSFLVFFFSFSNIPTHQVFHAPSLQQEIPFEFRIRYKFLSHTEAVVRYGTSSDLYDLGLVTPGTYCTRQFEECYRNKCRLQSPNYPGMYPRNVTCYWTIRQKTIPTCKHAMIAVSQENSHKSLVKRSIASLNKTARTIRAWSGNQMKAFILLLFIIIFDSFILLLVLMNKMLELKFE